MQIARNEEFIYVAFRVFDSDIENLSAKGFIQGQRFSSDDRVAVYIDSFNDRRNVYFFQVNGNGIRRDALTGNDYFIEDWSTITIWYAGTKVHEWGWTAEMAIPAKSIAFDPNASKWGINFARVPPRRGEEMAWSSRERSINPSMAGYIDGADNDLFVGRATRNVFNESEVGLIATSGDPTSANGNRLIGADYTYRNSRVFGNQRLTANAWYQETDTDGFNDQQSAFGFGFNYPNFKYSSFLGYRRIEENFNPALGFVNRVGVEQIDSQARYRHRLQDDYWQWLRTRVQYFRSDRIGGGLQSERAFWNIIEGFSEKNDFFTFFVGQVREGIIEPFEVAEGIEIPVGDYSSNRHGVFLETGPQQPLRFEFEISDGDFFGGTRLEITPEVQWRPSKHVFLSLSAQENRVELPQGNFTSRLYSARFNYAFDSRWAWLNVIQADNFSDTVSINSRIRFQQRADREYFLVFNQTRDRDCDEILDSAIVFKAAFNFRI